MEQKNDLRNISEDEMEELKQLRAFKKYFDEMFGQGLEVANWHLNGDTEPFDNFHNSACEKMRDATYVEKTPTTLFADMLNAMDMALVKTHENPDPDIEDGVAVDCYRIVDQQEVWDDRIATTAEGVLEELDTLFCDYVLNDLEKEMKNEISEERFPKDFSIPTTAESWIELANKSESPNLSDFIKAHQYEFDLCDMVVNHIEEVDLDKIIVSNEIDLENIEQAQIEAKSPTKLFGELINTMEFQIVKDQDYYNLIDLQEEGVGYTAKKRFENADSILKYIGTQVDDYLYPNLEEGIDNILLCSPIAISERYTYDNGAIPFEAPQTAKDWLDFANIEGNYADITNINIINEIKRFKEEYASDLAVLDMIVNHLDEVNLDEAMIGKEVDLSNAIDMRNEIIAYDEKINVLLFLTDDEYETLTYRTNLLNDVEMTFEELINNTDITLNAYIDVSKDGSISATIVRESDEMEYKDYALPLSENEKKVLVTSLEKELAKEGKTIVSLIQDDEVEKENNTDEKNKDYQVITYDSDSGFDEKLEYATLVEAEQNAENYLNDDYAGYAIFNKETMRIEKTEGDFSAENCFSQKVLELNNYPSIDKKNKKQEEYER